MANMTIYICNTLVDAKSAEDILKNDSHTPAQITTEKCDSVSYDSKTFGGGECGEVFAARYVVTGRK